MEEPTVCRDSKLVYSWLSGTLQCNKAVHCSQAFRFGIFSHLYRKRNEEADQATQGSCKPEDALLYTVTVSGNRF